MADFLMTTKGTAGDVIPLLGIGSALQHRGHTVTLFTHGYFEALVKKAGLGFVPLDTLEEFNRFVADGPLLNDPLGYPQFFQRHILPKVRFEYQTLRDHCSTGTVLLGRYMSDLAALMVAEKLGLPFIRLFISAASMTALPIFEALCAGILSGELNSLRAEVGLPPVTDWSLWLRSPRCGIAPWADWFAAPEPDWPPRTIPVGFVVHDETESGPLPEEVQDFLARGEPPILITGGTGVFLGAEFYSVAVEGCRILGCRALLVSRHEDLVPAKLPAEVRWFKSLPFASLMPHVAAVVHHGGTSTLARALITGVPQLLLTAGGERPNSAARLKRLGVGDFLLPPRWQPELVAAALNPLTHSAEIRARCQALAQRTRETDPASVACAVIESALRDNPTAEGASALVDSNLHRKNQLSPEKRALLELRLQKKSEERKA
jgi:rhamnosyltransferase subunit B